MTSVLRVGLYFSKDKKRKIKVPQSIDAACKASSIQLIEVNPDKPLDSQGPFDVIIHKVLDLYKEDDDSVADQYIRKLTAYCNQNPSTLLMDPVSSVQLLADRPRTLRMAEECQFELNGRKVFVPSFLTFDGGSAMNIKEKLRDAGIQYPVVCKSVYGAGHASEHIMSVVFSEDFLDEISYPCIIQQFINHGGIMYKIYVIGDKYYICERPSIRDLNSCQLPSVHFKGTQVSKEGYTLPIHPKDLNSMTFRTSTNGGILDKALVLELLRRLKSKMEITLYGIDIIIDERTGNFGIVDINYFPGYGGVLQQFTNDLFELLKDLSVKKGQGLL